MTDSSRRAVVEGAIANASPAGDSDSHLLELEQRWLALQTMMDEPGLIADDESGVVLTIRDRLEDKIMGTPAQGFEGLMVKARRAGHWIEDEGSALEKRFSQFMVELERLAGAL